MSWLRGKSSDDIRASALVMARRKLTAGCRPCALAYLDLARSHGATEADLADLPTGTVDEQVTPPIAAPP